MIGAGTILSFLGSKIGITLLAIVIAIGVFGVQQYRINSYKKDVAELNEQVADHLNAIEVWKSELVKCFEANETNNATIEKMQNRIRGLNEQLAQEEFMCTVKMNRIKEQYEFCCNATNTDIENINGNLVIDEETNENFKKLYNRTIAPLSN